VRARTTRSVTWLASVVALSGLSSVMPVHAQSAPLDSMPHDSVHAQSARSHYLLLAAGALGAATFNHAAAVPSKWKRTWGGYGARVGDQVGFAATEEVLRFALMRVVPAHGPATQCVGATSRPFWPRVGRALSCGVVNTLVVRERSGARRPNVPLLGAIVGASAVSLAWRPERADAGKGITFLFTRIGVVTGGTAANAAWGAYRGKPQ